MPRLLGRGPCSTRVAYRGVLSPDSAMLLPQRCQVVPGTQSAKNDTHATSNTMDAPGGLLEKITFVNRDAGRRAIVNKSIADAHTRLVP